MDGNVEFSGAAIDRPSSPGVQTHIRGLLGPAVDVDGRSERSEDNLYLSLTLVGLAGETNVAR